MKTKHGKRKFNKGSKQIMVAFFERGGGAGLRVYWAGPGFGKRLISSKSVTSTSISGGRGRATKKLVKKSSKSKARAPRKAGKLIGRRRKHHHKKKHKWKHGTGRGKGGWRATYWNNVQGLRTVGQAIKTISKKAPGKIKKKLYSIYWKSTNGHWSGLDKRFKHNYVARFKGRLRVPLSGKYKFYTTSDDGSMLYVNGKRVVNNDGQHGMRTRSGRMTMKKGSVIVVVDYFQRGGGKGLKVEWSGPGFKKRALDGSYMSPMMEESQESEAERVLADMRRSTAEAQRLGEEHNDDTAVVELSA